ncbi:hypothetical protein [uncultured Arcobacter sp.]|uniref:hypothetical protein n=1 Tax=uncultured Arcobacter sp. TaxID=165434 RepID=UPI002639FC40|nr:hypothetical protein [uncultured Arcobacter sp.]
MNKYIQKIFEYAKIHNDGLVTSAVDVYNEYQEDFEDFEDFISFLKNDKSFKEHLIANGYCQDTSMYDMNEMI